jgi:hypothetical protein
MALDLTALSVYTDENKDSLIAAAVAGARSAEVLNLQTGYKSAAAINILDTDVVFQDDVGGRTPEGTTTLTQRVLTVGAIKVEEDIDVKALNKVYQQHNLKAGSKDDVLPFEEEYTELKSSKISKNIEKGIWQGDKASADVNLNKFDGLLKIIDAEATVIDGNPNNITEATQATSRAIVDDVYAEIPDAILEFDDVIIACGVDFFRKFIKAIKAANLFHDDGKTNGSFEYEVEAGVRLVGLHGLSGTERLVAGRANGMVVGTDLENEEEEFEIWYSKDDKCVKFDAAFKYGTQIAFPEEIVEFTLAV